MTTEISTQLYIETSLQKFNVTDAAITDMNKKYSSLIIKDVNDKKGYLSVREARLTVKSNRIDVDKKRKELTADALKFQKAINAEAARITALLEPIETHLKSQEDFYDAEKERIKQEKEKAEQQQLQGRIAQLLEVGFNFDGVNYISDLKTTEGTNVKVYPLKLKLMSDIEFQHAFDFIKKSYDENEKKLAEIERLKKEAIAHEEQKIKEEAALLAKQKQEQEDERQKYLVEVARHKQEQEAENTRLAVIAKEQEKKAAILLAQEEKIKQHQRVIETEKNKHEIKITHVGETINEELPILCNLQSEEKKQIIITDSEKLEKCVEFIQYISALKINNNCAEETLPYDELIESIKNKANDLLIEIG